MIVFALCQNPQHIQLLAHSLKDSSHELQTGTDLTQLLRMASCDDAVVIDADFPQSAGTWASSLAMLETYPTIFISDDPNQLAKIESAIAGAICLCCKDLCADLLDLAILQAQITCTATGQTSEIGHLDSSLDFGGADLNATLDPFAGSASSTSLVQTVLRQSLAKLFPILDSIAQTQRWLDRWKAAGATEELAIPSGVMQRELGKLLREAQWLADASRLADDRASVRRETVASATWLNQLFSRFPSLCLQTPDQLPNLRIDPERTQLAVHAIIEHFAQETPITNVLISGTETDLCLEFQSAEEISIGEFELLKERWETSQWPRWMNDSSFTLGLGLAREQLRCMGGELKLSRSMQGCFGVCMSVPLDEPTSFVGGYRKLLHRKLTDAQTPIGAFLAQCDRSYEAMNEATDELLRQRLGSCGLVVRRGERTWAILAPVGADESGEFVQWLQHCWTDSQQQQLGVLEATGLDTEDHPRALAISTIGHLSMSEELENWVELYVAAMGAVGPFGNEPPVVLISRAEVPVMDGLTQRLAGSGCSITQVNEQGYCPDEWDSVKPQIVDLRTSDSEGWKRLDELVRTGSLSRQVILLTESLQKQNDRLLDFGRLFETNAEYQEPISISIS